MTSGPEKFLTLDVGKAKTAGLYFRISKDRKIVIEKLEEDIDLPRFLRAPLRRAAQASWEGKHFFEGRRRMLAAADATLATTIPVPLSFRREPERRVLGLVLGELDDYVGGVLTKVSAECRVEAAHRFGIEPVEVVLVAARALDVAVDGRKVARAEGVLGQEVSFILELTFTRRALFDQFKPFFNAPEPFLFMESPQARLTVLSLINPLPLNLIVTDRAPDASLFVLQKAKEKYPVLYRERFPWPFEPFFGTLMETFAVSRSAAEEMERMYVVGAVSPRAARVFDGYAAPLAEAFGRALRKAKVRGPVFIDAPYPMPFALPYKEGGAVVTDWPLEPILAKFDLTLEVGRLSIASGVLWRHLAPFLLMYFDRAQGTLNERLRKRVHWLAG